MDPPDIVLSESRMEQATELLRACSPRDNSDEKEPETRRPTFMRQNSKEMQSAVDMPRGGPSPVSFEKQSRLSVSGQPDPWQDDGEDNVTNYSEEDKAVSSWSAITSKVSAPKKSGKRSRKSSKSKQSEVGADGANEDEDSEKKGNPTVQKTSFASLPTDSLTDAWVNDESGKINSEDEEDEELKNLTQVQKPLALLQPSYARVASHEAINTLDDPPLPAASEVVALKPASSLPMVINVEETQETEEIFVDEEGFEPVASRKAKRERKISKRYSQVSDDMENEAADKVTTQKDGENTQLSRNLANDSFWSNKYLFDDAEAKFYAQKSLVLDTSTTADGKGKKRKDGDDNGKDKRDDDDKDDQNKSRQSTPLEDGDGLEENEYNWTDESTYLSPKFPVLTPIPLRIKVPTDPDMQIKQLTEQVRSFSATIETNNDAMKDHINNNNPGTLIRDPTNIRSKDEKGQLQVELESLAAGVTHVEETLQRLSDEQLSGQLAVVKYALATLEELEKEAQSAEVKLAQETEAGAAVDRQALAANLTSCRTRIVTLNTQALASKGRLEGYMAERKKRIVEIKRYQALLVDLEAWLGEAQSTISSEIKLTSAKVVRDQIRASQTLEADLRSRSGQLDHLLKEVDGLSTYTDVQSLVHEMKDNLGTLMVVMKEAQACLAQRLANLQVR